MATAKPATTAIGGGDIGLTGSTIYIKAERIQTDTSTRTANVTGDGDTDAVFVANGLVYVRMSVQGWMESGQSTGSLNAIKAGAELDVVINFSASRTYTGKILVERALMSWTRQSQTIPLSLTGVFTGAITEA